jgi:DnaJ-class molecular chaperone
VTVLLPALIVLAVVIGWYVDVRLRPWKPCPWCGGRRRTRGSRPKAYGKYTCRHCGGKGELRRAGAGRRRS